MTHPKLIFSYFNGANRFEVLDNSILGIPCFLEFRIYDERNGLYTKTVLDGEALGDLLSVLENAKGGDVK